MKSYPKNLAVLLIITFCLAVIAQDKAADQISALKLDENWTRINAFDNDFSIALPNDFLVHAEKKNFRFYYFLKGLAVNVELTKTKDAQLIFVRQYAAGQSRTTRKKSFIKNDFSIITLERDDEEQGFYTINLIIASEIGIYSVFAQAENKDDPLLKSIIDSVLLKDTLLNSRDDNSFQNRNVKIVKTDDLESSPLVKEYLDKKSKNVRVAKAIRDVKNVQTLERNFSRPLIILEKPFPGKTPEAIRKRISGSVIFKIRFLATGEIESVEVIQELGAGLTNKAIKAAKKIKFIPAEINGKPVDSEKTVRYDF